MSNASRSQLFGQLGLDIFTVFSGGNRLLYERAILAVYNDLYKRTPSAARCCCEFEGVSLRRGR
ncbi:hypothetical protein CK222_20305 [Mesorhizobium sp. WSM3866]|nr:hypothetical protein CK222_20305 [Mesorhizobium sp. WSM3866]